MIEELPTWISAPLILILGIVALYRCYILPNTKRDKND